MAQLNAITLEQLEGLALQIEADDAAEHARLMRLCRAMVRILAARQPELFVRRATSITDEAGHYDNSYPPKPEFHRAGGPRLFKIRGNDTDDVPTSGGFYYSWKRETAELGCYVGRDGVFRGCDESGTGRLGQFAAHPGDCEREIEIDWPVIEPTLDDLRDAEPKLREALAAYLAAA
jgi:hypothetical protein